MSTQTTCAVCDKPTQIRCSRCWGAHYCTGEHQRIDWSRHKKTCRTYNICEDESGGRYIVAKRPLREGETVFEEAATIFAPSNIKKGRMIACATCTKLFDIELAWRCTVCGWLLCSETCSCSVVHIPECSCIGRRPDDLTKYQVLEYQLMDVALILRTLYQKRDHLRIWNAIMHFETPYDKHSDNEPSKGFERRAREMIRIFRQQEYFGVGEVKKLLEVISTYGFGDTVEDRAWRGIFKRAYLLEHNCMPNCQRFGTVDNKLRVVATKGIEEGERLSISYVDQFLMTHERQEVLRNLLVCDSVACRCTRCLDITEFRTNFSLLQCQRDNCSGLIGPASFIDEKIDWKCNVCTARIQFKEIVESYKAILSTYVGAEDVKVMKLFLTCQDGILPSTHCYILKGKMGLINMMNELSNLSNEDLELKISTCREVLNTLEILLPADKGRRALVLFPLQEALDELYIRKKCRERSPPEALRDILEERRTILNEILAIRKYDSGKIYKLAERHLDMVTDAFKHLQM